MRPPLRIGRAAALATQRHDQLQVGLLKLAHWAQGGGLGRPRELEPDLRTRECLQRIAQVRTVESDLPGLALHAGVELSGVVAVLGAGRGDHDQTQPWRAVLRRRRAGQAHYVGVVARKHTRGAGGSQQLGGADDDCRRAVLGDDALEVGELIGDQAAGELDPRQRELQPVRAGTAAQDERQPARGGQSMSDLAQGGGRDDSGCAGGRLEQVDRPDGQAVAVGRGDGELGAILQQAAPPATTL